MYPAYIEAHEAVFEGGDVENGAPTDKVPGLIVLESLKMTMGEAVGRCCEVIKKLEMV